MGGIKNFSRSKKKNTSALSSRWRFVWTSSPYLIFSIEDFHKGYKFIADVLSRRNDLIEVFSLTLKLSSYETLCQVFLKRVLDYADSHNVQQLTVECLFKKQIRFPVYLFRSQSLKHLRLTGSISEYSYTNFPDYSNTLKSSWKLPALTTLHLDYVKLCDGITLLFSTCANLKNLTLNHFRMRKSDYYGFKICHPCLSSLTLENGHSAMKHFNVVAPQLKKIHITNCYGKHQVSAPELASLLFKGYEPLQFSTDDLNFLEKVDFCIYYPKKSDARELVGLLQRLHNVKFLTLNSELIEVISSSTELISLQPSPFVNLRSLMIYPQNVSTKVRKGEKVTISMELKNFLLDSSPSATFTIVSYQEIRAHRNAVSAQNLMAKLWVTLEEEKANSETNTCHRDQMKAPMGSHEATIHEKANAQVQNQRARPAEKMQMHIEGNMAKIMSCWEDLGVHINQGKSKMCDIISMLREIEVLFLLELPPSKRDKLLADYRSLYAEADTVVKKIIDGMKIQWGKKQRHLSYCFYEL